MQRQFARRTGPGAGVVKYDVITAMSLLALRDGHRMQTTVLRLIALVTARYNWKADYFTVPQSDMARMWNVSDRTVKREIKRMISSGLVFCVRPGVRGRVGAYRLNYQRLCDQTRETWTDVGVDFDSRMQSMHDPAKPKVVKVDFGSKTMPPSLDTPTTGDPWREMLSVLQRTDPANLHSWYMKLELAEARDDKVSLRAPSSFIAQFVQTHLSRSLEHAAATALRKPVRIEIRY